MKKTIAVNNLSKDQDYDSQSHAQNGFLSSYLRAKLGITSISFRGMLQGDGIGVSKLNSDKKLDLAHTHSLCEILKELLPAVPKEIISIFLDYACLTEDILRALMGNNFIGGKEWEATFGKKVSGAPRLPIELTDEFLDTMSFQDNKKTVKESHILILIPTHLNNKPYSLETLNNELMLLKKPRIRHSATFADKSYALFDFFKSPVTMCRWVLMSKHYLPHTFGKSFLDQKKTLKTYPEYKISTTLERTTGEMMYYLKTGDRLSNDTEKGWYWVRTLATDNLDYSVGVCLDNRGLNFNLGKPEDAIPNLGLAVAWKRLRS